MGWGGYSYFSASSRAADRVDMSAAEIFKSRSMNQKMDICDKIRECCDSEEHPNTLPIIIALDVTGSMGRIPENLIKGGFAEIMNSIYEAGVVDPQVCFLGIGDPIYDDAPLQVAQFETSDQTLDEWLESMWIEGGGGGNNFEGYILSWYFAARHTNCDAITKRGQKGILITIGDEKVTPKLTKSQIRDIFGDTVQDDISCEDLFAEVSENWNTYHISMAYRKGDSFLQSWNFLGDNHIVIDRKPENAIDAIVNIVKNHSNSDSVTPTVVSESSEIL